MNKIIPGTLYRAPSTSKYPITNNALHSSSTLQAPPSPSFTGPRTIRATAATVPHDLIRMHPRSHSPPTRTTAVVSTLILNRPIHRRTHQQQRFTRFRLTHVRRRCRRRRRRWRHKQNCVCLVEGGRYEAECIAWFCGCRC